VVGIHTHSLVEAGGTLIVSVAFVVPGVTTSHFTVVVIVASTSMPLTSYMDIPLTIALASLHTLLHEVDGLLKCWARPEIAAVFHHVGKVDIVNSI
jgi:hypothetical protein